MKGPIIVTVDQVQVGGAGDEVALDWVVRLERDGGLGSCQDEDLGVAFKEAYLILLHQSDEVS